MHKAIRLKVNLSLWIEGEAEPAREPGRQLEHERVDDEREQPERQEDERQREELHDRPDDRVDEAEDDRDEQHRRERAGPLGAPPEGDAGDDEGRQPQRESVDDGLEDEVLEHTHVAIVPRP